MDAENHRQEPPRTEFINIVAEKIKAIQEAPIEKFGRKMIQVPVSLETAENARKALVFQWKQQSATTVYPNPAPNPRHDKPVQSAFVEYEATLAHDVSTRTRSCSQSG
ncbi:hypothetical protein BG011_004388 [Mortierella polycephala]|uniref:Uncharacterized protein n=1 Tax=Mortierella polycephala TaxID=41804 RepID=A0A9P6QDR9_9FUNG|nr:hypothetical protein BG011_004388 [Mortierella polycephala]